MDHTYEELRGAALEILAGREKTRFPPTQYEHFKVGVAEVLMRQKGHVSDPYSANLSRLDSELFLEIFWDLFRQGVITLGMNDSNREFPFFRVSKIGAQAISKQGHYLFHDVSAFTTVVTKEVPNIDPVTLLYLQEAVQAFRSGCLLSCSVMLGVATEHTFLLLLEGIEKSPQYGPIFATASKERTILQKANKFKNILDQHLKSLPPDLKEDLDTQFAGILSIIRTFRNQSGHPSGKLLDREQAFILVQLFVPYCKKIYALRDFYK